MERTKMMEYGNACLVRAQLHCQLLWPLATSLSTLLWSGHSSTVNCCDHLQPHYPHCCTHGNACTTQVTTTYNKQIKQTTWRNPITPGLYGTWRLNRTQRESKLDVILKTVCENVQPAALAARDLQLKYTSIPGGVVRYCMTHSNLIITWICVI